MYEYAPGLFVEESTVRFYGVRIQTRMAIVSLPGDRLLLYSPVPLDSALREKLDELGQVATLVSPNKIHNQTLAQYQEAYPEAKLHVPPGLAERRRDLRCDAVLEEGAHPTWRDDLDCVVTRGNVFFSEVLLLHRRSRTLLVGDFIENFDTATASRAARSVAALFGVRSEPCPSPEFRFYTHDAAAAEASLERARLWEFDRIVLCHGGLVETDAREIFLAVVDELLEAARSRGRIARWLLSRVAALQ